MLKHNSALLIGCSLALAWSLGVIGEPNKYIYAAELLLLSGCGIMGILGIWRVINEN